MKTKLLIFVVLLFSSTIFAKNATTAKQASQSLCGTCSISTPEQYLAYMPVILFALILVIIFWKLSKESYKIGDALKENTTIEISEDNPDLVEKPKAAVTGVNDATPPPADTTATTPFVPKTIQPKSISRLIAFISGLVSVGIAASLCSFWMYNYFKGNQNVDLSHLTNVLLSLGIGVIPYAVNKISTSK